MENKVTESSNFDKLWDLKARNVWFDYEIYATTKKDLNMDVWNGRHPVDKNTKTHICKSGSRVRVWMVSRFGDVGVTDNLVNPVGYNTRGLDADLDLENFEFISLR